MLIGKTSGAWALHGFADGTGGANAMGDNIKRFVAPVLNCAHKRALVENKEFVCMVLSKVQTRCHVKYKQIGSEVTRIAK